MIPPATLQLMAQFNPLRGQLRRRPQETIGLKMPFDDKVFNFTRVSDTPELLCKVNIPNCINDYFILINNSPIEFASSLLIADAALKLPQILTLDSIVAAVSLALASQSPDIKLGFNSLGAAASVNHQHWHLYYQRTKVPLQTIQTPSDGLLSDWLIPAYVVQLSPLDSNEIIMRACEKVMKIATKCLDREISHNLFICKSESMKVRLFFIPRKQNLARIKDDMGLIAAFCEFSGFFICKTQEDYDSIDEERVKKLFDECKLSQEQLELVFS